MKIVPTQITDADLKKLHQSNLRRARALFNKGFSKERLKEIFSARWVDNNWTTISKGRIYGRKNTDYHQ